MKFTNIIGIGVILILFSCSTRSSDKENKETTLNFSTQNNVLDTLISGKRLFIADTTKYSALFINELKSVYSQYDTLKVINDSLFIYSRPEYNPNTIEFYKYKIPTELKLKKEYQYSVNSEGKEFILSLKRTNFTNLEYKLKQGSETLKSGVASLQGSFFFGSEGQDDEKGEPLFLSQYLDNSSCGALIKIEVENANRAIIEYCSDIEKGHYNELPIFKNTTLTGASVKQ